MFLVVFAVLFVVAASALTLMAYAGPDLRLDARGMVLNGVWSVILAGLATALLRGVWALVAG